MQENGGMAAATTPTFWAVVWDWTKTVVLCVVIAFAIKAVVIQSYTIDGTCMEPTLYTYQRVFIFKPGYWFHGPERGDIIVFRYPLNPAKEYIKRVIGVPGETVAIHDGVVYINGQALDQSAWPVTIDTHRYPEYAERVIPPGQFFVLGDNRPQSEDSRVWGFVPRENVLGPAFLRFWPIWNPKWIG